MVNVELTTPADHHTMMHLTLSRQAVVGHQHAAEDLGAWESAEPLRRSRRRSWVICLGVVVAEQPGDARVRAAGCAPRPTPDLSLPGCRCPADVVAGDRPDLMR